MYTETKSLKQVDMFALLLKDMTQGLSLWNAFFFLRVTSEIRFQVKLSEQCDATASEEFQGEDESWPGHCLCL